MIIQVLIVINNCFFPPVAQFVSRTGKTSDLTQIKGWRDKFATSAPLSEGMQFSELFIKTNFSFKC